MAEIEPTDEDTTTEYLDDTTDMEVTEDTEGTEDTEREGKDEETVTEEETIKEEEDEDVVEYEDASTKVRKKHGKKKLKSWMERYPQLRVLHQVHFSKSDTAVEPQISKTDDDRWPGMWPCTTRDMAKELLERRRQKRMKRKDLFPCDPDYIRDGFQDPNNDYSDRKELGHARIPQSCPLPTKEMLVDRAAGEQHGLVDGDYIIFELPSKARGTRIYADVCLRGLKGMHLPELGVLRARKRTWKFCFYQAIVALLAKTQLRYKYAWSANIDYVYDHAWLLYTHMGMINIKDKQRLDDIVVYNYKYSIEVRLIQELNDVPIVTDIPWDYEERNMRRKMILERKELMNVKLEIGSEKITDEQIAPVHRGIKRVQEWFDKLKVRYRNCIFRTTRFSVAFWKDNLFWYLYNPYRCDEFGYWDDNGYACILKFCSKESLTRHLMILLLRAYVYTTPKPSKEELEKKPETDTPVAETEQPVTAEDLEATEPSLTMEQAETATESGVSEEPNVERQASGPNESVRTQPSGISYWKEAGAAQQPETAEEEAEEKFFTIQIFHVSHLCCQIHNLKLLQRGAPKPPKRYVKKKTIDDCPFDPLDMRDPCTIEQEEGDLKESIEKPTWLKLYKITWTKSLAVPQKKKGSKELGLGKMRWHQYVVEESNKLFSLWGEIHITDGMFERENRGMQTYACYVVCAGMTRIMAPEYWSSKTLDVIVMCGDRYYTHSKLEAEFKSTKNEYSHVNCWNRYLMSHFKIGETMFEAKVLPAICGRLYAKSGKYLWQSLEQMFLKYKFGILTCESSCLGVFKFCGAYYMCDVNSLGPPLFSYGEGAVYLLRATYFLKFITVLVLTIGSPECSQFALNPIEILKVVDVGPSVFPVGRAEKKDRAKRGTKVECPYDEEKKKQMKKWKHKRAETARTIDKLCCKGGG
ncbi:uncharacterized protein LOC117166382 [Bombus vancouverensis nearcticus]|uniref:uncharacterized protein LOC117166382 n=1 Tax=Bombus vancouverensis nearcticus TaxID=2705178 RepID=UPI00402B9F0F